MVKLRDIFGPAEHGERRRDPRMRPFIDLIVTVGRLPATIIDISEGGARVRHSGVLKRGVDVRFRLRYAESVAVVDATILSSTVVSLGSGMFETRLEFRNTDSAARAGIANAISALKEIQEQAWIRNAQGEEPAVPRKATAPVTFFIRLIKTPAGWKEVRTANPEQPPDGLTVPASTDRSDIEMLCQSYDLADAEGKDLLRAMSASTCVKKTAPRKKS